jgi:hypothetical protein
MSGTRKTTMNTEFVCFCCGCRWISDDVDVPACPKCHSEDTEAVEQDPEDRE